MTHIQHPADADPAAARPTPRRVRHEVRDGLYVMGFSLAASTALALLMTVLSHVGG